MEREIGRERSGIRPMPTLAAQRARVEDGAPGFGELFMPAPAMSPSPACLPLVCWQSR